MPDIADLLTRIVSHPWFVNAVWAVVLFLITLVASRVATRAVSHVLHHDSNPLPTSSIIINIVRAAIWFMGVSIILDSCTDINTSSLVTALGVGGIAVSLGFQDTLSNLIGGLQVTFMGIVKPGDNIEVGSASGVVQDVSWRHTTIKDALGQTIIIPNSIISTTALVHLLPANRVSVPFAVPRHRIVGQSADEDNLTEHAIDALSEAIIEHAREAAGAVSPVVDGPRVFFSQITEFGIKGSVVLQVEDASKTALAADAVVRAIARHLG